MNNIKLSKSKKSETDASIKNLSVAEPHTISVAIMGLGYVGLPLAIEIAKHYRTVGFDINLKRVEELEKGIDRTNSVLSKSIIDFRGTFSANTKLLRACNLFLVTVPTPVDQKNKPDFTPLKNVTKKIGSVLQKGSIICYESTVCPGTTEEICVPILEEFSGLKYNIDFTVAYSPERVNPGDKDHLVTNIVKVTSGSDEITATFIDQFYRSILKTKTFKAKNIKVAEAAKILENTQRDVNIGLINEFAIFCDQIGIEVTDVLEAARTKWNFLDFTPGLVGGHCISVDPYYLIEKSETVGTSMKIAKASREVNEKVPVIIAEKTILGLLKRKIEPKTARILILGISFKENCPDTRNSKVINIIECLTDYGSKVDIYDPVADLDSKTLERGVTLISSFGKKARYHAVIGAVGHKEIKDITLDQLKEFLIEDPIIFDVKNIWPNEKVTFRL